MADLTFDQVTKIITREVMEQYEQLRQLGPCNMFDVYCVEGAAHELDFEELAEVYIDHYGLIWQNFGKLMRHYGIEQPAREAHDA